MRKGSKHSPEARSKISASKLGKKMSAIHLANWRAAQGNISQALRNKMRAAQLGKKRTPESIAKMIITRTGVPFVIPAHLKSYAQKLRRNGIKGDDMRKALEPFL